MAARGAGRESARHAGQLARLRALAHPLRFRVFQEFAGHRRTTRQVAEILGEPPTRLYHHVNLLERAGLLRLVETRPNRGATEKYYEVAAPRAGARRRASPGTAAARRAQAELASLVFDEARLELLAAIESHGAGGGAGAKDVTTVARTLLTGGPAQMIRLRKQIIDLIRRHARAQKRGAARAATDGADCWSLTFAILPRRGAPKS